tara:strand:- start:135 stop:257 length:123 start_codon:yes stop_codon:yes gene_type:complete
LGEVEEEMFDQGFTPTPSILIGRVGTMGRKGITGALARQD